MPPTNTVVRDGDIEGLMCPLALGVARALQRQGDVTAALVTTSPTPPGGAASKTSRISAARLCSWITASVSAIRLLGLPDSSSPPVLALALPACSMEESAWMLLVASQPNWVFVPIDPHAPRARQLETLTNSCVDGLVTWEASGLSIEGTNATRLPALTESSPNMQFYRLCGDSRVCGRNDRLLRALYVIPTSGTTGQVKGVVGTRVGALERVDWARHALPMSEQRDAVLRATRLSFVDAVAEILGACLSGVTLVHLLFRSDDGAPQTRVDSVVLHSPSVFVSAVAEWRITRLTVVPSVLRVLLRCISTLAETDQRNGDALFTSLQVVLVSGEPLRLDVVDEFFCLLPHASLVNLYGSTEVSGDVTWKKLERPPSKEQRERWHRLGVPIGDSPVSAIGTTTQIRLKHDGSSFAKSSDELSEIWVRGGAVAAGYLVDQQVVRPPAKWVRDPDGTEWFRMGDLCRVEDKELFICGRKDRQVKLRGNRLQLEDIERCLKQVTEKEPALANVVDIVVSPVSTATLTTNEQDVSLNAFLLVRGDHLEGSYGCEQCDMIEIDEMTMRSMVENVVEQFGALFVPRRMNAVAVAKVPRYASGKINVSALGAMSLQHKAHGSRPVGRPLVKPQPLTSVMTAALNVVEKVLGLPYNLSREHSGESTWLELGGDSLRAAMLSWELKQALQKSIPAHEILELNVDELLNRVSSKKRRLECSSDSDPAFAEVRTTVQPRIARGNDTKGSHAKPSWAWYSRYNQTSSQLAGHIRTCGPQLPVAARLDLNLIAQKDLGKCIDASPLILRRRRDDGALDSKLRVLVGSHAGKFVCVQIDSATHEVHDLWTKTLDDRIEATATFSVENGLVFVGTYSGRLYALDLESGDMVWQFHAREMIKSSALVIQSLSLVIVGAYDQRLYALDIKTGAVVWVEELPGSVFSSPLFDPSTRQLVAATTSGVVISWLVERRERRQVIWKTTLPAPVFASLVLTRLAADGVAQVLVGCADAKVYALSLSTGSNTWSFPTLKPIFCTPCVYHIPGEAGIPAAIVGSHDGKLRKLSLTDGARVWETKTNGSSEPDTIFASPYVASLRLQREHDTCTAIVCAATTSGRLVFLEESTGREIPSANQKDMGEIFSSPVIVEDLCFVGTRSNQLLVLQLQIKCP